ncbi:hypothetical protein RSAG8_09673, partial [Rhizoctonia solani AG-8 WAC10335]
MNLTSFLGMSSPLVLIGPATHHSTQKYHFLAFFSRPVSQPREIQSAGIAYVSDNNRPYMNIWPRGKINCWSHLALPHGR